MGTNFDRGGRTAIIDSYGKNIELTVIPPTEVEADGTATAKICPTCMGEDDVCGELTVRQLTVDEGWKPAAVKLDWGVYDNEIYSNKYNSWVDGEMNPETGAWRPLTANMSMYTPFGVGGPFRFAEKEDGGGASYAFVPSVPGKLHRAIGPMTETGELCYPASNTLYMYNVPRSETQGQVVPSTSSIREGTSTPSPWQ